MSCDVTRVAHCMGGILSERHQDQKEIMYEAKEVPSEDKIFDTDIEK